MAPEMMKESESGFSLGKRQHFRRVAAGHQHSTVSGVHARPNRILVKARIDRSRVMVFMIEALAGDGEACSLLGLQESVC